MCLNNKATKLNFLDASGLSYSFPDPLLNCWQLEPGEVEWNHFYHAVVDARIWRSERDLEIERRALDLF